MNIAYNIILWQINGNGKFNNFVTFFRCFIHYESVILLLFRKKSQNKTLKRTIVCIPYCTRLTKSRKSALISEKAA